MAANINKLTIIGNLGHDPELRHTAKGNPVMTLSVATSSKYKTQDDGREIESTEWHRAVVWGKKAENCAQFLKKGNRVYLEGPIRTRSWKDKEGQDKKSTEIQVSNIQFLGSGKNLEN
jgi:single-strand DNA-binding protein